MLGRLSHAGRPRPRVRPTDEDPREREVAAAAQDVGASAEPVQDVLVGAVGVVGQVVDDLTEEVRATELQGGLAGVVRQHLGQPGPGEAVLVGDDQAVAGEREGLVQPTRLEQEIALGDAEVQVLDGVGGGVELVCRRQEIPALAGVAQVPARLRELAEDD